MLRDFVATTPDRSYKRCYFSCPSSISLSPLSSLASLLHVPLIRLELTDRGHDMGNADKMKPPRKQKVRPTTSAVVPSQMQSAPSTSSTTSHTRSISSALRNARSLPRKASRLVCIGGHHSCRNPHDASDTCPSMDQGTKVHVKAGYEGGGTEAVVKKDKTVGGGAIHPGLIERSSSGNSSGSGSSSNGYSESSGSCVMSPTSSSASSVLAAGSGSISSHQRKIQNVVQKNTVLSGPILSPTELAKALEEQAVISEPQSIPSSATYEVSFPISTPFPSAAPASEFSFAHGQDPIPRALSPPPEHFRRRERVLSASGVSVSGSIASGTGPGLGLGPYTTPSPTNSPPCSPRANQLRLHELLSSESLVAPRINLYNSAVDSDSGSDGEGDAKSVKSDFGAGSNTRRRTGTLGAFLAQRNSLRSVGHAHSSMSIQTGPSSTASSVQDGGNQKKFHTTLRSHSRLRSPGPLIEDDQDTHALRRVFSR
ncbi:hypothetical protein A7U60_g5631 [Sanghuangporus baumii]|uniref:Uncharacterized protein n=1 Tax=Sanghuangporus baumii TaxID=108892 RepID=A0A9Q5N3C0_SANBA|nr:hypothetical protein A7U60_g5631 [Sanghuangporus baumii]